MAPPSKLTPERQAAICQAIKLGATYELAAHYGGIHPDTLSDWMKHKPAFNAAVRAAEGQAAVVWLAKIEQAASDGNWQAAAWKLERRYPGMYGKTVQEHQGADGGPIQHEYTVHAADDFDRAIARLFDRAATDALSAEPDA